MANRKYNRLTLSPHDEEDQKLFYDFRLNEICVQYLVIIVLAGIAAIIRTLIYIFLDDSSTTSKQQFFIVTFALLSVLVAYVVSLRWKRLFPYLLVMQYLCNLLVFLVQMGTRKEPEEEEWTFNKHMELMDGRVFLSFFCFIYVLFFSPSLGFTACTYLPIAIVSNLIFINLRYDMTDSYVFKTNIAKLIAFHTFVMLISYMTQVREIIRFYEQQTVIKKEQ